MKQRLMIQLSEPQYKWMVGESRRLGISIAEFVRRVIDGARPTSPDSAD